MKRTFLALTLGLLSVTAVFAQNSGWPRRVTGSGGTLLYYEPQVDNWQDFQTLQWRMAFTLTPSGGKAVVGAATLQGNTASDISDHTVAITNIKITNTYFPSSDPGTAKEPFFQVVKQPWMSVTITPYFVTMLSLLLSVPALSHLMV